MNLVLQITFRSILLINGYCFIVFRSRINHNLYLRRLLYTATKLLTIPATLLLLFYWNEKNQYSIHCFWWIIKNLGSKIELLRYAVGDQWQIDRYFWKIQINGNPWTRIKYNLLSLNLTGMTWLYQRCHDLIFSRESRSSSPVQMHHATVRFR